MAFDVDNDEKNSKILLKKSPNIFYGCCGDTILINFKAMDIHPVFLPEFKITWTDSNLWEILFLILILLPAWIFICCVFLEKKKLANTQLGESLSALTTTIFLILSFIRFLSLLEDQPHWEFLQSNIFIVFGYFIILVGLARLHQGIKLLRILPIFKANSDPKFGRLTTNGLVSCMDCFDLESTLYFGNSLLHLGTSLIYASQAGMFITFALGFSYIEIFFIRKNFGMKMF